MTFDRTIGIFDSGYGGFSVLCEAALRLRGVRYLYYADTDHVPYGSRSNEEILRFSEDAVKYLISQGADAVIIACNTASAVASAYLRSHCALPIIAMEPAVRPALREGDARRILVMATPVTLREEKLKNLIRREHGEDRIDLLPMPGLVELAEREAFESDEARRYVASRLDDTDLLVYSSIVLGCTHFNYFKPLLRRMLDEGGFSQVHLIEGSEGTVRRAASLLGLEVHQEPPRHKDEIFRRLCDPDTVRYFASGREVNGKEELAHIAHLLRQMQRAGEI